MLGKFQIKPDIYYIFFLQKTEPAASVFYTQITEQADEKNGFWEILVIATYPT